VRFPQNRKRTFPKILWIVGIPFVIVAWIVAARLVWEQTVLSWKYGLQMAGFAFIHSGPGPILLPILYASLIWLVVVLIMLARTKSFGGKFGLVVFLAYGLAVGLLQIPYGFWQRIFLDKYPRTEIVEIFTRAAAVGELSTVKALLSKGMDVNARDHNGGTALHGAALEGRTRVMDYLIAHGAAVNSLNDSGDSPLAYAKESDKENVQAQELLIKHGGKVIRGTEDQHNRAAEERLRLILERDQKSSENKGKEN